MLESYYTVEEAANILKLHKVTLTRYLRKGYIPASRIGPENGPYRISESDLKAYLETQKKQQQKTG